MNHLRALPQGFLYVLGALALLAGAGVFGYMSLYRASVASSNAIASSTAQLEEKVVALSDGLYAAQQGLAAVQERLGGFENTVGDISGTVDVLEKLRNTDRELLQKYSKVFFLNEHYAPSRLAQMEEQYIYDEDRPEKILAEVRPYLEDLLGEAQDNGVDLYVRSAYRSFEEQKALKSGYTVTYGAGTANAFSADQGYSEHQLGTTLDLSASRNESLVDSFDKTETFAWLTKNAYKYGFILSYPKSNGYYVYEPWHWRFVGVKLATYLHKKEKNFYDLEQREIDEYLVDLFD
ncbi:MAG TPA: M15 family metallopeptidase [Candidatus Paceibacterota bacterium]